MDISSWSEMEIMNMDDLQYIDHYQTMNQFDEFPYNNNPFSSYTYNNVQSSQVAEIFVEKPVFCSPTVETRQNTSTFSSPSPSSSPSVISFSNSPTATSIAAQKHFENLNTPVKTEVPSSGTTIKFSASSISMDSDFDDSQHLIQALGFEAGDFSHEKKSYSRTPLQAQDHVLAERKRRERLTQSFITLSSLIPDLKKLDKASILGNAIIYIKQLAEQVKALEEQAKKCNEEPVVAVKRARIQSSYDNSNSTSTEKSVPEIEVRVSDGNILIRIYCKKQARLMKEIFSQVEKFHLTIISSSVIPFGYTNNHITIIAQMDHQLSMKEEHVVNKIREAIMKLI